MPEVTAIKPQKKPGRYNIFIDERFAFGLDEEDLYKSKLKTGQILTEEDIPRLKKVNEEGKFLENILHYLEFRPRSEREIRGHLKERFYKKKKVNSGEEAALIIENILERLRKLNLLDDRAFAVWWLQQRQNNSKPLGRQLIRLELVRKGVSREIIDDVLKASETNEVDLAFKSAKKKLSSYRKLPKLDFKLKMTRYLLSHGYSGDVTRETIKRLLSDFPTQPTDF